MRITAPLLTLAGTVAGTAAAVVAYQSAAGPSDTTPASSTTTDSPAPVASTNWLPCEPGWKLKGAACVRVKEKVVVVNDLPAPAAPQAHVATTRSSGSGSSHDQAEGDSPEVEHGDENEVEDSDSQEVEHEDSDHEDVGGDD